MAQMTEVYCLTVLEFRSLRSSCGRGRHFLEAVRENLFSVSLATGGLLATFGIPWLVEATNLFLYLHVMFYLCVCLPSKGFPSSSTHLSYWIRGPPFSSMASS